MSRITAIAGRASLVITEGDQAASDACWSNWRAEHSGGGCSRSARVLNGQLAGDFHRWYSGFTRASDPKRLAA